MLAGHMPHIPLRLRPLAKAPVLPRRAPHRPAIDLTLRAFGELVALRPGPRIGGRTAWWCRCRCGARVLVQTSHLLRDSDCGGVRSCGHNGRSRALLRVIGRNDSCVIGLVL